MSNSSSSAGGSSVVGLLTIAFVVLRLCEVIKWSWWWVLSPIWITGLVVLAVLCVALGVYALKEWRKALRRAKQ